MVNTSNGSRRADVRLRASRTWRGNVVPFARTALVVRGLALMLLVQGLLRAQTYVQVAELDPGHPIGSRITSTVTNANLSRTLFGWVGNKITLIDAVASPWVAYEFATDAAWNRALFGQKDVYIRAFDNSGDPTIPSLLGPGGVDVSGSRIVYIADRMNSRVLLAQFDAAAQTLTRVAVTPDDPDVKGAVDVAWDGEASPLTSNYFYVLDAAGRISWWQWTSGTPIKLWTYGAWGHSTGQFLGPKGICVGHSPGPDGGSRFTNDLYVADAGNRRLVWLQRITGTALWELAVTLPDSGIPADCTVDHFGNVTVADVRNSRLLKYTWNLTYLDQYGTYGTGSTNDNTFAHPHAIHAPFGTMNAGGATIWYGEGRVLTAEDWGAQSGAREHYLGIKSTITAQAHQITSNAHWDFSYNVTDHATHDGVNVIDVNNNVVRSGLTATGLQPPGTYSADWDGHTNTGAVAPNGYYRFRAHMVSAYGCGGSSWCDQTLTSGSFFWSPVSVSISGPNYLPSAGTYSWSANPVPTSGTYTYQWSYMSTGGSWTNLGTAATQSRSISSGTPDFQLRVTVSSASGSGSYTISVDNALWDPPQCNPYC